uniref:Vav guanine nucleotide exchange factor 3 n=1 Tax=Astyanax mexicanus TaxID=7994 RepID=A0A8B9HZF2_ASTMX
MEPWRQCALWLISCRVLPPHHRVTWPSARVFDLAQTLRDGVLLCQLLNNLRAHTVNLKEINLRPQMSQFLCLKNIRTFLCACSEVFGMKKSELFEAFDLFDVRDFGKVRSVYENGVDDEEDLYDCVYDDDEGGEVYEDLMKAEAGAPPKQAETDIRSCCLAEIRQTEEKYTETLESIEKVRVQPEDLVKVHKSLLQDVQNSIGHQSASNLHLIFIDYKERLLLYGKYCSQVETAIACLDDICKDKEDVRQKLEVCSKRANNGKFTLRDLLVVPMQRVLKYHLLLQELVKHTSDATEKSNLRQALDAMKDLAQYVNEVKRDNETLREIDQYQKSIENLNQSLSNYGRPKGDGEVRVASVDKRAKQDRHIFLFDVAVIVCKRRGDVYEMKEVIDLHNFKITNNPTSDKENRKWSYGFYLTHNQGQNGFEFFFKTKELKKKWLEQFGMAISNIRPENGNSNLHEFRMHTFDRITACSACKMLLRGIFNQGYQCCKCGEGAHKECLGRVAMCGKSNSSGEFSPRFFFSGLPKMLAIRNYYGNPTPMYGPALNITEGDIIELIRADLHSTWWQGKVLSSREVGFFPSDAVKPCPCVSFTFNPLIQQIFTFIQFAGRMQRLEAEAELVNRKNSTYLVRHRGHDSNEYAIISDRSCFSACFWAPHLLIRVIGVAIARYDFCSRDTRELSLQEGDMVKIYTKSGANGWWRGEVNGRVSLRICLTLSTV